MFRLLAVPPGFLQDDVSTISQEIFPFPSCLSWKDQGLDVGEYTRIGSTERGYMYTWELRMLRRNLLEGLRRPIWVALVETATAKA